MKGASLFSVLIVLGMLAHTTAIAQSVGNYAPVTRTTGITYTSISGTGNSFSAWRNGTDADDNRSAAAPIGFTFYYDGQAATQFSISTNGFIDFSSSTANGSGTGPYSRANSQFSTSNGTLLALGPLYDDLIAPTGGNLAGNFKYLTTGTPGSRVLTVEWIALDLFGPTVADLNFQVKLYEATGVIEMIYGTVTAGGAGYSYTCGVNGPTMSAVPTAAELLTQQTANTTTFSNTPQNALATVPASNTMLTFTGNVTPAAPTNITFTSVTQTGMTVGWTDDSIFETYFVVSRSTDDVTYTPVGTVTSTTTGGTGTTYSLAQSGLTPGVTYYFRITANNEASAPSGNLSGNQATDAPGEITSAASGNWNSTATWSGDAVPAATDNVTIADGHTVTLGVGDGTCLNLTVQGPSGILQYETGAARTLTVGQNLTIHSGGTLQTGAAGTVTTHMLSVAGNLTNNGTLDFSTNGNTAGAGITFTGAGNATFSGTGATTDLRMLTVNKGTSPANTLELMPSNLTVQGVTADVAGFLTLTNGTLKISGTFAMTNRVFSTVSYTIGATTGFWLNNPSFTVAAQASAPATVAGLLRISTGTYNVGTASNNSVAFSTGSSIILEGGTVTVAGRWGVGSSGNTITYNQSGGVLNLNTAGHTVASPATFDMGTSAASSVTMSGGTIVLRLAGTAASGPRDYRNIAGTQSITGGTLQLADGNSGSAKVFLLQGGIPNLVITNSSADGHTGQLAASTNVFLNTTISPNAILNLNGFNFFQIGATLTNNGTINGTTTGSRLWFLGTGSLAKLGDMSPPALAGGLELPINISDEAGALAVAQTYTGTGAVTAPLAGLAIENPAGVTIDLGIPSNIITLRVSLLRGTLINSSKVTLGNAGATSGITQIGAPGLTSPGGNYDGFPVLNHGTGGYIILYAQESVARTTGFEIPGARTANLVTIDNTNGVSLAGGGLSLTTALILTNGLFTTSSVNLLTLANSISTPPAGSATSYVNGPLAIEFSVAAPTNRTYAIGKAGAFRPLVLKEVNTGGVSQAYTAEVIGSASGGTPVAPLQALDPVRYWMVSNTTNLNATARVNLAFGADDAVPILSSARVAQANTSGGNYTSIGGATTGTPSAGTVESTVDHTPGDDFFTIGFQDLPYTWDAGGADDNWSNPLNWNFDSVPGPTHNVSLNVGSPSPIDVDGNFAITNLSIGNNVTLTLFSTNTLTVNGSYSQSGSTVILTAGTLEVRGAFTRTGGTFNAGTGTTLFSGAAAQAIGGGVTHYNLVFRNGGDGLAKILTAGNTFTVANDLTVESTAQLALSAATATTMSVAGNLAYSGIPGGTNIENLTFSLTGSGKTIAGAPSLKAPAPLVAPDPDKIQLVEVNLRSDPAKALSGKLVNGEKPAPVLENTHEKRRAEVEKLLASTNPDIRLVINLDDMTIVRNPASFAALGLPPSTFEMAVTVATGGSYTLADNIAIAAGRLITVTGKLDCATFTIGGGGGISVASATPPNGTLGIGVVAGGVGATILTTGTNTYTSGSIIEYNAAGSQLIHTASHPANAMIYVDGGDTKTLDANKTIAGNSAEPLTKGALVVAAGTSFADAGYTVSFTTTLYANVIVNGAYVSTGSGGISYESGPFLSNIRAVDGTTFGNLAMNFASSTSTVDMNAAGPVNVSFRNTTFGGTAGTGTAGGTLRLNETGTTNVTVTGDVSIAPATLTSTGGGFGGFASTVGTVLVKGNLTTTSTNATQPIMNNTGTNTLVMNGSAAQGFAVGASTTMFNGSTLKIDNASGVTLGAGPLSYRIAGTLNLTSGNVTTGVNTLAITSTGSVARTSGHVVGFLSKNVALGATTRTFEIGDESVYAPVVVAFGTVTTAGDLTATTTDGEHPNIGTSGLDSTSDVNRFYVLTNAGIAFDTYDGTFTFDPTDVDNGADPSLFVVRKYDAPNWSAPAVGTRTPTSTQATGMTSFSEFAIGGLPTIAITDASVIEGHAGTVTADFTVSVSAIAGQTITVDYETADSTATAGSGDYVAIPPVQTLTFNPNDPLTQTVSVTVNGDVIAEADELFLVNLSNATNATLADAQGVGTIENDDSAAITINDVAVTEGNGEPGAALATFTVTLSNPAKQVVTVDYETADSTATAASGDYVAISPAQTLTFNPGDPLTQEVSVTVNGDLTTELDETFLVNLSDAANATLADAQGVGTILNDDGVPRITINDGVVTEGNPGPGPGQTSATFTVMLSNSSKQVVTVDYATADSTAAANSDYVPISPPQTLTFDPGDPLTQTVTVLVNRDTDIEPDETYLVNLSNATNAIILDAQGIGTILNDDATTTAGDPDAAPVVETFVGANFPNPFAGETTIPIGLKQAGHVRMRVYDARGQLVRILVDESLAGGVRRVRWDGLNRHGVRLPSGFYVVRIEAEGKVLSRPLEIVR